MKKTIKIELKKGEILTALQTVNPAVAKTDSFGEIARNFFFFEDMIAGYNGERIITYPLQTGFYGLINANTLLTFIKKIKAKKIQCVVNVRDGEMLLSVGETIKARIPFLSAKAKSGIHKLIEAMYPSKKKKWKALPPETKEGIVLCSYSASAGTLDRFTGVYVSCKNIASTDKYRMSNFKHSLKKFPVLRIPKDSAVLLKDLPYSKISFEAPWLKFKTDDEVLLAIATVRTEAAKSFPIKKIKKVLKGKNKTTCDLPATEIKAAMERASIFLADDEVLHKAVNLTLQNKSIHVSLAKEDRRAYDEHIEVEDFKFEGELKVRINPEFLSEALSYGNTMFFNPEKHRVVVKSENFTHLITLHRQE